MKITLKRLLSFLILLSSIGLGGCEKKDSNCVNCWDESDPEVNFVYNLMPTKLCDPNPAELQKKIDDYEAKGYNCNEID